TRLAFTSAEALREDVLWVVGVVIAGLGVTSVIFARRLVRPLRQITDAAQVIRRGDYQQAIPITMHNEIGILVEEFNEMTGTVQDALGRLTREERKLNSVLNSIAEGIVYLDLDRRVVLTNPAAEHLLGLPDDTAGKIVDDLLDADVVDRLFSAERGSRRRARPVSSEASLTVGEETRALKVVSSPVLAGDDSPIGTVYALDDITREKEIEQMKSDFVALVSHELRTPLTSIYGYTRLILDGKTGEVPAVTLDKLVRVERQALRLSHLISDLLDLSRIESGRMEMRMAPTSIVDVAATRIEDIRTQADDKEIRLTLEAGDDVPDAVADGERIGQVLTNLLSNAVKFTPHGGSVQTRIRREGSLLSVQVVDTGVGIPPEERTRIFEKFHQVSNVHTRQQGGTGLGLAIARSIVDAHGGRIWVDDGSGSGSDFRFVLPLEPSDTPADHVEAEAS
ncbi:HAMP domain-containing protein, partial [Candidatus Poribacteria bacterium]|nr:HAMP domain-containing protein [Candidatus Poribacteria bacterium]